MKSLESITTRWLQSVRALGAVLLVSLLAACASASHHAPVESRGGATQTAANGGAAALPATAASAALPAAPLKPPPPGIENAGKPGYYAVKPGDTLIRIGLDNGQNWRDIARWNKLENANVIEVGQVLRVVPPSADSNAVVTRPVLPSGAAETRPVASAGGASAAGTATPTPSSASAPSAPASNPTAAREADDDVSWMWPAAGPVFKPFDEATNKGLAILGKAGDPVLAAADGRVVYAGSGLRGYGNLIIIKHNNTYLSAYAHNQTLLVKEDQVVRRGQKIAEMGSSDADRVQLHFEIRRLGKPVDPAKLLPQR